jgi:hypothetical protein
MIITKSKNQTKPLRQNASHLGIVINRAGSRRWA